MAHSAQNQISFHPGFFSSFFQAVYRSGNDLLTGQPSGYAGKGEQTGFPCTEYFPLPHPLIGCARLLPGFLLSAEDLREFQNSPDTLLNPGSHLRHTAAETILPALAEEFHYFGPFFESSLRKESRPDGSEGQFSSGFSSRLVSFSSLLFGDFHTQIIFIDFSGWSFICKVQSRIVLEKNRQLMPLSSAKFRLLYA